MKWCETRFEIFLSQTKLENDENKRNRLGWVGPTLIFYPLNFIFNVLTLRRLKRFFFLSFSFNLFEATKEKKNLLSLSLRSLTLISLVPTYLHTYVCSMINKEKSSDGKQSVFGLPFKTFFNRKGSSSKFGFKTSRQLTKVRKLENTKLYFCQIRYQPTSHDAFFFIFPIYDFWK